MLKKQIDHLLVKLERERKSRALPDLSVNILHLAREHGRISISCISNALGANRNTVKKHVQQLVEMDNWSAMERPAHLLFSLLIWIMRPSANTTLIFKTEPNTAGMLKVTKEPIEPNVHLSGSKGMQAIT